MRETAIVGGPASYIMGIDRSSGHDLTAIALGIVQNRMFNLISVDYDFSAALQKLGAALVEFDTIITPGNPRVAYLAYHAKRPRTRKKNVNRLSREFIKRLRRGCKRDAL